MRHKGLYIGKTTSKGRGVFTHEAIEANTVIEISPVIVMSYAHRQLLDQTLLHDYIFEWEPDGQNLCCMALGFIPMYNHTYRSNSEYFMNYDEDTMTITTVRDIEPGEEITINYNGDWDDERPVWFDVKS